MGVFLIFLALLANFNVDKDSLNASIAGDIIAINVVLQLPPRESSNNLVIFESLYGICDFGYLNSVKAAITLPNADKD